jgi:hypothetical protein
MARGTKFNDLIKPASGETKIIRGLDVIKEELEILLGFEKYSLFFGNNIGLDARRFLYLPNKLATFNLIKSEIEVLITKYNRVRLIKTEMNFNKTTSTLEVNITVVPKGVGNPITASFTLGD